MTLAERRSYQQAKRSELAQFGILLEDEPTCRECGCSDSLACPEGCWWTQEDLCSVCAQESEER
jgi:hypothetical protein